MHPILRPPFSPACFLQKFRDARKPPLKLKTKYTVIPRQIFPMCCTAHAPYV